MQTCPQATASLSRRRLCESRKGSYSPCDSESPRGEWEPSTTYGAPAANFSRNLALPATGRTPLFAQKPEAKNPRCMGFSDDYASPEPFWGNRNSFRPWPTWTLAGSSLKGTFGADLGFQRRASRRLMPWAAATTLPLQFPEGQMCPSCSPGLILCDQLRCGTDLTTTALCAVLSGPKILGVRGPS